MISYGKAILVVLLLVDVGLMLIVVDSIGEPFRDKRCEPQGFPHEKAWSIQPGKMGFLCD